MAGQIIVLFSCRKYAEGFIRQIQSVFLDGVEKLFIGNYQSGTQQTFCRGESQATVCGSATLEWQAKSPKTPS